mmetsp:Transcript_21300/g.46234  ORF Transcript_21300/g.46234 Transcript_21300/m.46234 type:complete len:795 (+) Transcript_21300:201-2585(+)
MKSNVPTTTMASAAVASNAPSPFKRSDLFRPRTIMALAAICYISTRAIGGNTDGVIVSAFSPPYRASPPSIAIVHGVNSAYSRKTRLAYKHLDNGDDESMAAYDANKNKTALNNGNVIYYNDLEDVVVAFSSNSYNTSSIASNSQSPTGKNDGTNSNNDLIHELEDTIKQNNKKKDEKKKTVIENWKTKMQRGNRMQTTNYLESLSASSNGKKKNDNKDESNKDGSDDKKNKDILRALRDQQANITNSHFLSTQAAFRAANRRTQPKEAIAKRIEDVQSKPNWKERDNFEAKKLERLDVERKELERKEERFDVKKRNEEMYLEERDRQKRLLAERAGERKEEIVGEEGEAVVVRPSGKRGIPILDSLSQSPDVDAPPLLIGSTLTFAYSDLTPFQKRALGVARSYHEERVQRMKEVQSSEDELNNNDDGGIGAAPTIAIIDSYTASIMESSLDSPSSQQTGAQTRYATLASIEMVESNGDDGEPYSAVKLTGVCRAFLHDYCSSKDAGMIKDEEELIELLDRIQEFDKQDQQCGDEAETSLSDDEENELPVIMAEFDLFLDNSSILSDSKESTKFSQDTKHRASSMHAITELYQTANKVYRLHEERKKLVVGLRAGVARLQMGKKKRAEDDIDENCFVEFEDCGGLGLIGGVLMDDTTMKEETLTVAPASSENDSTPRSNLETMDNYGFGSYGALSTIPDLTTQLTFHLEPYYSPTHCKREEFNAEVASMVIFHTLEEYATPQEVAMALLAPSATERLELGYMIMMCHVSELKQLVRIVSDELMECGEECTDLW